MNAANPNNPPKLPLRRKMPKIKPSSLVEMSIRIAKGLKSSYKNARTYTLDQAFLEIEKYTDNYEVLNPDLNRIYGDIDGKDLECSESEFQQLDIDTRKAIETFLEGHQYCLLTASSYTHRKISWRFVITNLKITLKDNKEFVIQNIKNINLPTRISFDSAPYGKNQKIRMVGSNKDGENRPLKLVKGEIIDTLISYIPDDCELVQVKEQQQLQEIKKSKPQNSNPMLMRKIVMNITNDEHTTWEQWYKVSQAIYNDSADLELFLDWSAKSNKHNERESLRHWRGLKPGSDAKLSIGSLFYWSKLSNPVEYENIILQYGNKDNYHYVKLQFEKEFFKLKDPVGFGREAGTKLLLLKEHDLLTLEKNRYFRDEEDKQVSFVKAWLLDPHIRTYEQMVFQPLKDVPSDCYNLFRGFAMPKQQGDISVMKDLLWHLSGKNQEVYEYVENYLAHLIQKPYQKAKKCILFQSEKQGAGKDTFFDAIGKILGDEYFYNTGDPENNVFGRFNGHLQKTLLLKLEEVSFEVNKKFESRLLNLITAVTQSYEDKGSKCINLEDYKRIIMTTNKSVPVSIPESDRRFVLINVSEEKVGNHEYWKNVYAALDKPETLQAYHWHLATKDISTFDLEKRPITDFYKDVKLSTRPYHATYFQNWLANNGEQMEQHTQSSSEWLADVNTYSKFNISDTKFGRDMNLYLENGCLVKKKLKYNNSYTILSSKMAEFLKQKGWWMDA